MTLLIICLLAGAILRRTSFFDEKSPITLNNLIIYFFIPIITFYHVPKISFEINLIWLSITPFLVYLSSFLFIKTMARITKIEQKTEGALIMCSGIGSISFVGFPIFEILYGAEGLAYGIILSLGGTFVVFNTVGISTGIYYAEKGSKNLNLLKKLFTFPPLVAFLIALFLNFSNIEYPNLVDEILLKLSAPFSVLALLAIGMQMDFKLEKTFIKYLLIGQVHKLLIAPLVIYLLMWHLLELTDLPSRICILGAAIGSMNAISIVAAQMNLNPKLATLMPAVSIPVSIPILFLIDYSL